MEKLAVLVERSQQRDEVAYAAIIEQFKNMAYGYAFSIVGDFHWSQDIAQDAFIETWECLHTLRNPRAFPGWFKRIVFKHCERFLRGNWTILQHWRYEATQRIESFAQ
jgi:DNA-directed RNA polymerase specialized sigma24 family protein